MYTKYITILLITLTFIMPGLINAGDIEKEKLEHQKRLEALRKEILQAEKLVGEADKQKTELGDQLGNLDHKVSLRKRLLRGLENDLQKTEIELKDARKRLNRVRRDVKNLETDIDSLRNSIKSLRNLVAERSIYTYKKWKWDEYRIILSAGNFNEALTRKKYFNLIADRDKKNLELLSEKKQTLNGYMVEKLSLEATLVSAEKELNLKIRQKEDLIAESNDEQQKMLSERKTKAGLLKRVNKDHASLLKNIQDKRTAIVEIERLIDALAKATDKAADIAVIFPDVDIAKMKGKMEWPARGEIVAGFGKQLNPKLNTWTENTGIDIKAERGANVHSVASGRVSIVTWLRGYGSTLIINHPGDYYTVYTHLEDILVNPGNLVTAGSVIGTVGDSGSLTGPKLHFEIWEKKVKHDPALWLKRG